MTSYPIRLFAALLGVSASATPLAGPADELLQTHAERTSFRETGRYDEVVTLCNRFARAYPRQVRCERFGTSPEGRPLQVLIASRSGVTSPEAARARKIPVVLFQGGIHAGEIDGKDAGFLALGDVLGGRAAKGALAAQVMLFVPVFNVDGHERFGRWSRPNQRGPEAMGWRTTAQNLNLNRDYMKADAPEMQAMLALLERWDPLAVIDLHVTNGAKFEHDVSIQVEPASSGDAALRSAGRALRDAVIGRLRAQGSLPLPFYPSFVETDNPASGFADGVPPPRFSSGYFPLRNRFGMLVETHSWKDYPTRVRITRNTVIAVLQEISRHGRDWLVLARRADAAASKLGGSKVTLDWLATDVAHPIAFRGYAYTRTPSAVSGALMTRYDEHQPQTWTIPLRDDVQPSLTVTAPRGGYIVPAMHADAIAPRLALHGIRHERVARTVPAATVESFRADSATFDATPTESRQRLTVTGQWKGDTRNITAGSLYVPVAQPRARVLIALLEPTAPDSLLAWGDFNHHFERKEYMEAYVAEEVGQRMLADDPTLRAEFEQRITQDPAFAKDPQARLEFFHRRHPSWDERFQLYPVWRVATAPR